MALRPCRECNAQVSTEAEVCPHCGVPNPTSSPIASPPIAPPTGKPRSGWGKPRSGWVIFSLLVFGFWALIVVAALLTDEKKTPEQLAQEQAQAQAQAQAEQKAREQAEQKAREQAEREARVHAEQKAREDARASLPAATPQGLPIESDVVLADKLIDLGNTKLVLLLDELAALVRDNGYHCDSVSAARPYLFTRGYNLVCNRFSYSYDIEDKGGNWVVKVE
jgi:hypothetical protein